jgi:hypothetical protein
MAFGAYRLDAAFTIKSFNPTILLIALKDVMFPFGNIRERQLEQNPRLLVNSDVPEKFFKKGGWTSRMVKEVTIDGRRYYVVDGMVFATREAALEYLRGKR